MRNFLFLLSCLVLASPAIAGPLECNYSRTLADGSKETGKLEGLNTYEVQGENESEKLRIGRLKDGRIGLEVKSDLDGKPYVHDLVSCDRFFSCEGVRKKWPGGKLKERKFDVSPSNYQALLQLGDRLLFAFRRQDPGFSFTYTNYPLVNGGFVGVEFECAGY